MRFQIFSLVAALAPVALADFKFSPSIAGTTLQPGVALTITLIDTKAAPAVDLFTKYTLELVQGGQQQGATQRVVAELASALSLPANFVLTPTIVALTTIDPPSSLANSYFFKLTSFAPDGGSMVNWSPRFDVAFPGGTTPLNIKNAVAALNGVTDGPAAVNNMNIPAAGAAGAAQFTVPYPLQTGLTKWAPMQPIPGTKITMKNFTPLFPTSAYTVATTWMPAPTLVTTVTESQTYSVQSYENPAAAQSNPNPAMAKYLKRWED